MAIGQGVITAVGNDQDSNKTNMMQMWRDNIEETRKKLDAPVDVSKSEEEAKADLEQKIRNGQAPCPTCAARTYRDQSDDSGVSFQAAKGIAAPIAGTTIMNHENEHVAAGEAKEREDGVARDSNVMLQYAKCPQCGRTYVSGGITTTTTTPTTNQSEMMLLPRGIDIKV